MIKTIWIDLRFFKKNDYYSEFVYNLINWLIINKKDILFKIFLNSENKNLLFSWNIQKIIINIKDSSFSEQLFLAKKIQQEKLDLMLFFKNNKPVNYKKNYILFYPDLKNLHFWEQKNFLKRIFINYLTKTNINNASKIICYNKFQKEELNDKLNINEEKIFVIPWAFDVQKKDENIINTDLKLKYNIKEDFIIYNAWVWAEKNLEKLINLMKYIKDKDIKISLVILDDETIRDINFRKEVINNNLSDKIFFIWEINKNDLEIFYRNCLAVIYPLLYVDFPFCLNNAIKNSCQVIASKIETNLEIFKNTIQYFNISSNKELFEKISSLQKQTNNYNKIIEKYNIKNSIKELLELI